MDSIFEGFSNLSDSVILWKEKTDIVAEISESINLYNIYDPTEKDIVSNGFLVKLEADSSNIVF